MEKEKMKRKKTRAFIMGPDTALQFMQAIKYFKSQGYPDTPELRARILSELAAMGKMTSVFETARTEDEIVEDYKKRGFNVEDRRLKNDVSSRNAPHNKKRTVGGFFRELARLVKVYIFRSAD